MMSGARKGKPFWLRRLVATAMASALRVLIVPGPDVARAHGLDVIAAGFQVAATPRHANVLMLIGPLTPALRTAATILYAQMMRPRMILTLGCSDLAPLPSADWNAEISQQSLLEAVMQLRKIMVTSAFQATTADFNTAILEGHIHYTCSMHPEIVQDAPGSCPKCGMSLIPRDSGTDQDSEQKHSQSEEADSHSEISHSEMSDGDMGFMSMVEVTKDLPRSPDGLPMDWLEVPFGPVFPGLPGGLQLTLTLDGDSVAKVHTQTLVGEAIRLPPSGMEASRFIEHLGEIHPLSPMAYRVLASRALEKAVEKCPDEKELSVRVAALERERIASHLGWLSLLGSQIGYVGLQRHAAEMQLECMHASLPKIIRMRPAVNKLVQRLTHMPLLAARLSGIGIVFPDTGLSGPVARASGLRVDARMADASYGKLSFEVINRQRGDALARLIIRLDEMLQSFTLIESVRMLNEPVYIVADRASGEGRAIVETPRGAASLSLTLDRGSVVQAHLNAPSTFHLGLLPSLLMQQELGDALTTVCSLDLSPWELPA